MKFHDDEGWVIDHRTFTATYRGTITYYYTVGNFSSFSFTGRFKVILRLPFNQFWNPPPTHSDPDEDPSQSSVHAPLVHARDCRNMFFG